MKTEEKVVKVVSKSSCGGGALYGLGMIGVFVYYFPQITNVSTFFEVLVKTLFWPGYFIFHLYTLLKM